MGKQVQPHRPKQMNQKAQSITRSILNRGQSVSGLTALCAGLLVAGMAGAAPTKSVTTTTVTNATVIKAPVNNATDKATLLKPALTQAIANVPDSHVPDNTQSSTPPPNAVVIADDGGEVDIGDGDVLPDGAPPTTNPNATTTNRPTGQPATPDLPNPNNIAQVPLGAVSPDTVAKFVKMIDVVRNDYVTPVDDEALFANAISGTLTGLDPYSEYLDHDAFNNLRLFTEGDVGSIGVTVSYHSDLQAWVFDEVLPNSPAAKAGIQRGNFLHQINDTKLNDEQTQQDIDQLLLGIAGTQVRLTISDSGRRKHIETVQRTLVQQQSIKAEVVQGIAVVQIPVFQNNTQQQLMTALSGLREPFGALILDIRNNPGGVLSAANDVASLFMAAKPVVQIKNRQGLQEIVQTQPEAKFADIPLAVIQNRYSASAAEVLASSLQENGRAKVYGETSYGKGSIQSIVPLNDNEAVKLTVAHYYSGQGKKIDGIGVTPDYPLTDGEIYWQEQVIKSVTTLPRPLLYRLRTPTAQAF